jgi:hypothetical protein
MEIGRGRLVRKPDSGSGRPLLVFTADEGPPPEEGVVQGFEEVARLRDEGGNLGAQVLGTDFASNFGHEKCGFHFELKSLESVGNEQTFQNCKFSKVFENPLTEAEKASFRPLLAVPTLGLS